jgi:DNA-binding response OmpR family regulator/predicted regulator of Ras-like GTPase activity (Roadblock/LC7/MglB family)
MALPNILVVDSDEGFGNMLKGGLNSSGYYQAECVDTGRKAMQVIMSKQPVDLVIIDMALVDVSPVKLVKAIRKAKSEQRIMLIPLMGQQLPEKMEEILEINGVLTKPFFVGDLPDLINQALGRASLPTPVAPPTPPPVTETSETDSTPTSPTAPIPSPPAGQPLTIAAVSQETVRFLRGNESEILRLLGDLNREVRAEAILLIAGQELIAQAGLLSRDQCRDLAVLVAQSSQAAGQAANFLGEPAKRFAQSLHEGKDYRVYTLTLSDGILLSLALSSNVPLGMIRHQCRQIGEQLSKFL